MSGIRLRMISFSLVTVTVQVSGTVIGMTLGVIN